MPNYANLFVVFFERNFILNPVKNIHLPKILKWYRYSILMIDHLLHNFPAASWFYINISIYCIVIVCVVSVLLCYFCVILIVCIINVLCIKSLRWFSVAYYQ